ncbi:hypothetical protein [Methylomicrobium sp. Wu6]|uniref:hypothetical protein n=1 Tax=Methylomicrobium sp. Wu6 TaxID=3107928 RepID=UPI002DD6A8D1|nr:hypothetical protein [Methylomicrobium sp. Wu6]MEC4747957.1 hypothetical protein [Methylomicrobium sp. Wu6]
MKDMVRAEWRIEGFAFTKAIQLFPGSHYANIERFDAAHEIETIGLVFRLSVTVIPLIRPFGGIKQIKQLNNHPLKAGGLELRTESPDTRRLNDAS